jgi:hypothetical protein
MHAHTHTHTHTYIHTYIIYYHYNISIMISLHREIKAHLRKKHIILNYTMQLVSAVILATRSMFACWLNCSPPNQNLIFSSHPRTTGGSFPWNKRLECTADPLISIYTKTPWLLVLKRTIPTKRPPFVGEVSANFCG